MVHLGNRLEREAHTVEVMIRLYCRLQHQSKALCPECQELAGYARKRLLRCPFGTDKPVCNQCPIHCYRTEEREKIKAVMRFAGPRMLTRHPVLALLHLWDTRIEPALPRRRKRLPEGPNDGTDRKAAER